MVSVGEAAAGFLAVHRRDRVEVITEQLVDTIESANPGYRLAGVVPRSDLVRSCRDNVTRVLELLAEAVVRGGIQDADHARSYDAARETGRRRAEQGLPLDDVLRSFRIGGRLIWDDILEQGHDHLDASEVRAIGTRIWEVVDETSAQVAAAYHLHERALLRDDEQQRAELWEGLLNGRAHEPGFAHDAARRLDLPVSGDLLVVAAPHLEVRRAEARLAPHASAWVRRTGDVVGLVALREDDPTEAMGMLHSVALREQGPLGVSAVVGGLPAADQGYRQATLALRAQGGAPGAASFDDRLPQALLLSAPDVASRLVARWLGPVLALPENEAASLVDTLSAWVAAGGSATRTAAAVPCHRNTVLNRLRRVTDLTGRALADDAVPVELDLALRAWRMGLHPRG